MPTLSRISSAVCALALLATGCDQPLSAPDARGSGLRGPQTLSLDADPLTLGFPATLVASGAQPGEEVTFLRGTAPGAGLCPAVLGGLCVDVIGAAILGRGTADDDGVARLTVSVPAAAGVRDVALQAVVADGVDTRSSAAQVVSTTDCIHVPADHPTVQQAIDASADGDTVCVASGTYAERIDLGGRSIALLGEHAATTVIDGGGPSVTDLRPVLDAGSTDADTRIAHLTVTGGHTDTGAGVKAESSSATFVDLVVTGNSCDVPFASSPGECIGTGVWLSGGAPVLTDVTVSDNQCDITTPFGWACDGTGLYAELGAPTLRRVEVHGNTQDAEQLAGAGVMLVQTDATLEAVEVWGNAQLGGSRVRGAGLLLTGEGDVTYTGGEVRDNTQSCDCFAEGAGVLVELDGHGSTALTDVAITDNIATTESSFGTGMYLDWATVTLQDVEIARNQAVGDVALRGVGVFASDAVLTGDRVTLAANEATHTGGLGSSAERLDGIGLCVEDGTSATLTNAVIVDNVGNSTSTNGPSCEGGGVYTYADLVLRNTILAGNACEHAGGVGQGGGLYVDLISGHAELSHVDVVGNTASVADADGIYASANTDLIVDHSSISDGVQVSFGVLIDAEYSNFWGSTTGFTSPAGVDGNIAVEPLYIDTTAPDAADWDLHLDPSSILVDAGDPTRSDVDGTRADIGAHGGPDAALP